MTVDKERAGFMVHVSHDLKTPLNAVIGFASVLIQDSGQDPGKRHQLELVYQSARHLLSRIDALCNFYRMEAGILDLEAQRLEAGRLVSEQGESFRQEAEHKGLELEIRPAGTLPVRVNPRLFGFAFSELVSNAIRHTDSGAVILEAAGDDREVRFSVADSGPGIPAGELETLGRSLAGDSWEGLGLGLALARQAAALMGGRIRVENLSQGGCKFELVVERGPD